MLLGEYLQAAPFSCTLSSGFFGFYAHTGFLLGLAQAGLRPTSFTGSSAGALVAGVAASGTPLEVLRSELLQISRSDFWDPSAGWGLLRGEMFRARIAAMLATPLIEDCPRPLAISVFSLRTRQTEIVRSGEIAWAIRASCSFPGLLQPAVRDGVRFIDGGVLDRPGLAATEPGERRLFHHLVSSSPWRKPSAPSAQIPEQRGLVAVALAGLPRSGPFALAEGRRALSIAQAATARALETRIAEPDALGGTRRVLIRA